jgi:hypothetical protein
LPDGISPDQKSELLKQAFLNRSVLLVLDDCWDVDHAKKFAWIDTDTTSKILISSRIRDVLEGGQVIDVMVPSQSDAVKMLISTAGMDIETLHARAEVAQIAELCKRLPLTIGVAGKLIRQLAHGSTMSEASDWADVVTLLEDELSDSDRSIEESVISASIKAIPGTKRRNQATRLFYAFALVPEDTHVPLDVLGMIFDACSGETNSKKPATKPLSRLQIRQLLKVLIDRSLVLGTVDRPQLHDVMLVYVQKQLSGEAHKTAQRTLVDALRMADRSPSFPVGKYMQQCVRHHIKAAYDETWASSPQAISWLEDHVHGVQDAIAATTASLLPVESLAKDAETAEMWWQAALRWSALSMVKTAEAGNHGGGTEFLRLAVNGSLHVVVDDDSHGFTQSDLDTFDLLVRCAVFDKHLHSRMPLRFTPLLQLKQAGM